MGQSEECFAKRSLRSVLRPGPKEPPALNPPRRGSRCPVLCCVRRWNQIETELTHVVLNPTHVARYQVNTLTLGTLCSPRMR